MQLQAHRDSVRIVLSATQPARDNAAFHLISERDGLFPIPVVDTNVWVLATSNESSLIVTESSIAQKAQLTDSAGTSLAVTTNDNSSERLLAVAVVNARYYIWNNYFILDTGVASTLSSPALVGDKTINLVSATGFVVGGVVDLYSGTKNIHMRRFITAIVANAVTLDAAIDVDLAAGSLVELTSYNMAVNGSVTPVIFSMRPTGIEAVDLTQLILLMLSTTAMDDGKFGGITALTNGVHLRKAINNGASYETLAIWKANKDIAEDVYNLNYSSKAPSGQYGVSAKWMISDSGAVINLTATAGEWLEMVIQDDLTGLIDFQVKIQGNYLSL